MLLGQQYVYQSNVSELDFYSHDAVVSKCFFLWRRISDITERVCASRKRCPFSCNAVLAVAWCLHRLKFCWSGWMFLAQRLFSTSPTSFSKSSYLQNKNTSFSNFICHSPSAIVNLVWPTVSEVSVAEWLSRLTAVWEDPGLNHVADSCVYRDSCCDIQSWARAVHLYCSA